MQNRCHSKLMLWSLDGVHTTNSEPVIRTMRLLPYGRVLLISDQPPKFGVASQANSSPSLNGDVAAGGVQVAQDHHILAQWKVSHKSQFMIKHVDRQRGIM